MSYEYNLLADAVLRSLRQARPPLLGELTRDLHVSRRTLENAVTITTGKTFRDVREELLVERVKSLLESHPTRAIKELSY